MRPMHPLMKMGIAVLAVAAVVVLVSGLVAIWQTYPHDMVAMRVTLTAVFAGVAGFGLFVVGFCIDMSR